MDTHYNRQHLYTDLLPLVYTDNSSIATQYLVLVTLTIHVVFEVTAEIFTWTTVTDIQRYYNTITTPDPSKPYAYTLKCLMLSQLY